MTQVASHRSAGAGSDRRTVLWYARNGTGVDPRIGSRGRPWRRAGGCAAEGNAPNALHEQKAKPGCLRYIDQSRAYMHLSLIGAAIAFAAVGISNIAILFIGPTLLNAIGCVRQEGKEVSVTNILKSMMKVTAGLRRGGTEVGNPAEAVVVGDIVLLAAAPRAPAGDALLGGSFA